MASDSSVTESIGSFLKRLAMLCWLAWLAAGLFLIFLAAPLLTMFVLIAIAARASEKRRQSSGSHGTAEWADVDHLRRTGCLSSRGGVRLGNIVQVNPTGTMSGLRALLTLPLSRSGDAVAMASSRRGRHRPIPVYLPDNHPHVGIFGSSGGGKTTCYAIPTLFGCSDNMFVLDVKGELARLSARYRHAEFGHQIVIIDPYQIATGCGFRPARFNPLDLYRGDEHRIVDEARRMAGALVVTTGHEHDPFWPQYARTILTATLAFLMANARCESSLNHLRDIISNPRLMNDMIQYMLKSEACGGLLSRLAGQLLQCQGQTKSSAYSVANSHIDFLDSLSLAECLSESTFDPHMLINGRMTVYVCLPVDRMTELAGIQRILLSCFINLAFGAGESSTRRIRYLLDESATLGKLDALYNALQFGRSFGVRLKFLFQSTSQVERCFPESQRDDFFATVASVYCSTNDYRSAKDISDYLGQQTIYSRSEQTSQNWGGGQNYGMHEQSTSTNWGGSRSIT
ncbi:MAG: type IV secretory system conjugative DNA transfer family protein, partial [Planctomyces sp.]